MLSRVARRAVPLSQKRTVGIVCVVLLLTVLSFVLTSTTPTRGNGDDGEGTDGVATTENSAASGVIKSNTPNSDHNSRATVRLNTNNNMPADIIKVLSMVREAPPSAYVFPFQPSHLKSALKDFYKTSLEAKSAPSSSANSVQVGMEDLEAAQSNLVYSLPTIVEEEGGGSGEPSVPVQLFNAIKDDIQSTILDGRPIVIDFGCALGRVYATANPNATVICVHENGAIPNPDTPAIRPPLNNLIHIATPTTFLDPKFIQFYDVCNFFTVVIAMYPLFKLHQPASSHTSTPSSILAHLAAVLPSSAVVFTAVPDDDVAVGGKTILEMTPADWTSLSNGKVASGKDAKIKRVTATKLLTVKSKSLATFSVIKIQLFQSTRTCRKTWNAPLVQWGRTQAVHFNEGRVAFEVYTVNPNSKVVETTQRVIHPLQYIHSINLDTLLGVGLDLATRMQLLGHMIATPRYSDPLPHNWVIGGGGRVLRIDKIDARYDSKVDESKGYWGRSTRGYIHLLTYHLCIPISGDTELPLALFEDHNEEGPSSMAQCPQACRTCADTCSYLPKGSVPCKACVSCGMECLGGQVFRQLQKSYSASKSKNVPMSCQKTYPSMHAARKVWAKWEVKK